MNQFIFIDRKEGLGLKVYVVPRASVNQIVGIYKERLKIKIAAPATENLANKALIAFISKTLKIPLSSVSIFSGHTSKNKNILISGIESRDQLKHQIMNLLK